MEFGRYINYSYIILDRSTRKAAIVDPSWDLNSILNKLREIEADLTTVLLTHSHIDHVNLVSTLTQNFEVRVVISEEERNYYSFSCKNLKPARHLDEVKVGNTEIACLLTPGHTAGGMCYLVSDSMFTGDTIFTEGCGMCSTEGGCPGSMFESIQMIKRTVGSHVKVFPGHSYGQPVGRRMDYLMKENIYFQIDRKEHFIRFRMRKGQKNLFNFHSL